ncbi:hypothetical protein P389DRAFT_166115 [Cystobasidium minutum MCA 4210]|uniref:uncharacterized protein n=1 Tax=Cystobasidium minutum MCA 4210 TaxID=1397322 RepID=UPI0034CEDDCC|eukprot:jgi/Rhomi1/166115/fgenesh1_kg.1_\
MSDVPEWKSKLQTAITENMKKDKDSISYPLSTIGPDGKPKTRFVLHRGFVNERRKEEDPSNNPIGEEDTGKVGEVLLSTTDVRAPKSQQLSKNPHFELAWWFAPSGDQFRITGRAYILGPPDHPSTTSFLSEHGKRLAPPGLAKDGEFNWEDERRRIYEKISPPIRASFARPIPGTPLKDSERSGNGKGEGDYQPDSWPQELKMDDDKKLLDLSYSNFALTILEPLEIDWCQLNTQPNQRVIYSKDTSSGKWSQTSVVP